MHRGLHHGASWKRSLDDEERRRGRHLWAKSDRDGQGHSLLAHMLDVGLVAARLVSSRAREVEEIAEALELDPPAAASWLAALAGLHDLGKATPVFQALWPDGAPEEALGHAFSPMPHGRATTVLLAPLLRELGFSRRTASPLAHAVGVHHGWVDTASQIGPNAYDPRAIGEASAVWERWRQALAADVLAAFGAQHPPSVKRIPSTRIWTLIAGLAAVADWLGSGLAHKGGVGDVGTYLEARQEDVEVRLAEVGWQPAGAWWRAPMANGFAAWFAGADTFKPRPMQLEVERVLGRAGDDAGLIVIEAPMGEGKTEAAFYAMVQPGAVGGAFYALPTQATSDAMAGRLAHFVELHAARPVHVALAHGGARTPAAPVVAPVDAEGQAAQATASAWFSTGRRELLAELGVGTVDQALLGVLPTKHHFVRLWALAGRTLVIDEVHAYDTYTGSLVAALVEWLAALGGTIIIMSATLPRATTTALVAAYARGRGVACPALPAEDYPRLTMMDRAGGIERQAFAASRTATLRLEAAPYALAGLASEVLACATPGAAVGVVVNRVDRAQALYQRLVDSPVDVVLLHARFPKVERSRRERAIVERFGPAGNQTARGGVVIGTQVIEQSLDLDFDVLISDLAPIDLLFQRSGRLHRHKRPRPAGHEQPVLRVAGLGSTAETGPEEAAVDTIYAPHVLWRTWAVLVDSGGSLRLPSDLDALVQRVYGEESLARLDAHQDLMAVHRRSYEQAAVTATTAAAGWSIPTPERPATEAWNATAGDDCEQRPWLLRAPTRLGEDSVTVVPVMATAAGWVVAGTEDCVPLSVRRAPPNWIAVALDHQIRISRKRIVAELRKRTPPAWWLASGPLRYMAPLELDSDGCWVVDAAVHLDPELGLVTGPLREGSTP